MCSDGVAARSSARSPRGRVRRFARELSSGETRRSSSRGAARSPDPPSLPCSSTQASTGVGRGRERKIGPATPLPDGAPRRRGASRLSIARRRRPLRRRKLKATRASSEAARLRSAQRSYLGPKELGRERAARSRGAHAYPRRPAKRRRLGSYADVPKSHLTRAAAGHALR